MRNQPGKWMSFSPRWTCNGPRSHAVLFFWHRKHIWPIFTKMIVRPYVGELVGEHGEQCQV